MPSPGQAAQQRCCTNASISKFREQSERSGKSLDRRSSPNSTKLESPPSSSIMWVCFTVNRLKTLTILIIRTLEFTHAEEFEQGESESSTDTVMSYWPFIAGGAAIIIFLLVVMVCCIVYKQNKTSDQPYYANSQKVRDASKDQIIYENDQELRKKNSKRKRQFSSFYINRPENKVAIYVNSEAQEEETYANCTDHDYENVE